MADTKISGMTAASALTGAEVLPVVQSAANVKATAQQVVDAAMTTGLTRQALGSISTNTTIDWSAGSYVTATIGGALTFTFSNPAPTGKACVAYLQLTNGGSAVITWPVSVTWSGGTAPTLSASGVDLLRFYTQDNGTTWFGTAEIDEQQFDASALVSGLVATARLGSGTANSSTFLRGDQTYATPASSVDIQEFAASGTWTKPANAKYGRAVLVGGGGAGMCGACSGTTSVQGGSGGGGGRLVVVDFDPDELSATQAVTIGAGATGAAGVTSGFGVNPSNGGDTTFASYTAKGGKSASNSPARGEGGGSYNLGAYPSFTVSAESGSGGVSSTSSAAAGRTVDTLTATGGGAGGWVSAGGAANAGAAGGRYVPTNSSYGEPIGSTTAASGGAVNTAGSAGTAQRGVGHGGGGGGASVTGTAGAGGAGGYPGGGGGGGGAAITGGTSGAGGNGANGYAIIVTFCG